MPILKVRFSIEVSERDLGRLTPADIVCHNMEQILNTLCTCQMDEYWGRAYRKAAFRYDFQMALIDLRCGYLTAYPAIPYYPDPNNTWAWKLWEDKDPDLLWVDVEEGFVIKHIFESMKELFWAYSPRESLRLKPIEKKVCNEHYNGDNFASNAEWAGLGAAAWSLPE